MAAERNPSSLTKFAESRHLDRATLELVRTVATSLGAAPKDPVKVRAARARWDRVPPRHA